MNLKAWVQINDELMKASAEGAKGKTSLKSEELLSFILIKMKDKRIMMKWDEMGRVDRGGFG